MLFDCNLVNDEEHSRRGKQSILDLFSKVIPLKNKTGLKQEQCIDIFVNSHRDTDHLKGLKDVNERFPIKSIWDSGQQGANTDDADYQYYMRLRNNLKNQNKANLVVPTPSDGVFKSYGDTDVYEGVDLADAETVNTRWSSAGPDKKDGKRKKVRLAIPSKLDRRITALRRSHLGFIFQTFNLIPVLNVYENIEFPLLLESKNKDLACPVDSFTKKQKEEWIHYLMEKTGLTDWEKHKPSELSGGQRQRVAIARALVTKAPVILADEPTANLDSVNSAQILSLMKDLNRDPELLTTFIFSTHDSRIVEMCDHVVHIFDGNIKNDEHKTGSDVYNVESK